MVCKPVLGACGAVGVVPVEEDEHTRRGLHAAVDPLTAAAEPVDAPNAALELWDDAGFEIAALIGAPAHEDRAPFHSAAVTVPGPIGFAAHVADLGERHGDNGVVGGGNAVKQG